MILNELSKVTDLNPSPGSATPKSAMCSTLTALKSRHFPELTSNLLKSMLLTLPFKPRYESREGTMELIVVP